MRKKTILSAALALLTIGLAYLFLGERRAGVPSEVNQKEATGKRPVHREAYDTPPRRPVREDGKRPSTEAAPTPISKVAAVLSGIVKNETGEGLEGVEIGAVHCDQLLRTMDSLSSHTTKSMQDGVFLLTVPNSDLDYRIGARADGYVLKKCFHDGAPRSPEFRVPPGGVSGIELIMARCGMISGRVVDLTGRPVPRVWLNLADISGTLDQQFGGRESSDDQGRFTVSGLDPGQYAIWGMYGPLNDKREWGRCVSLGDRDNPFAVVALGNGEWKKDVQLVASLDPRRSISGTVVGEDGKPLQGTQVWAEIPGGGGVGVMPSPTPASGEFIVEGILFSHPRTPERELTLVSIHAECEGHEPLVVESVAVGSRGAELRMMRKRRGTIAMRLTDAASGEPVGNAQVYLWRSDTEWGERRRNKQVYEQISSGFGATPAPDGWYRIEDVPAGTAELAIVAEGYGFRQESDIPVRNGETTEREVTLEGSGEVCAYVSMDGADTPWDFQPYGITCYPQGHREKDHIMKDFHRQSEPEHACGIDEQDERIHRHFHLSPGEYEVVFSGMLNTEGHEPIRLQRTLAAPVTSGELTRVSLDFEAMSTSATVIVQLPDESPMLVCLVRGSYSDSPASGMDFQQTLFDALEFQQTTTTGAAVEFPFVTPGEYTAICFPNSDVNAQPSLGQITVNPSREYTVDFTQTGE